MPSMTSLSGSMTKYQKPIFLVIVIVIVLGGLYLIATMYNTKDAFTNGGNNKASKFSTTEPTSGALDVDWANSAVFVFHKMDGCGHCVHFAPVWQKVAEAVMSGKVSRADGKPIVMVIVDTEHPLSAGVTGYPTIRKYMSASPKDKVEFEGRVSDPSQCEQNLLKFVSEE